jgi:hypothetical protein
MEGMSTKILVGKPEEKRPVGKPRRSWKDQNRIGLSHDRRKRQAFANTVKHNNNNNKRIHLNKYKLFKDKRVQ